MRSWIFGLLIALLSTFTLAGCKTTKLSLNEIKSASTRKGGLQKLAERKAKQAACNESCKAAYDTCFSKCKEVAESSEGRQACGQACGEARKVCLSECREAVN